MPTNINDNLEQAPLEVTQYLELLQLQKTRIKQFESELFHLKKQYASQLSQFGTLALWYQKKTPFEKQLLFGKALLLAFTLGILINIFFMVATAAIYFVLISLFSNYYQFEKKRCNDLCHNIINMEKELRASLAVFNQLQLKLLQLFQALRQKEDALTTYRTTLAEQTINLNEQAQQFEITIDALNQNQELFKASTQLFQTQSTIFCQELDKLISLLSQQKQAVTKLLTDSELSLEAQLNQLEASLAHINEITMKQQTLLEIQISQQTELDSELSQISNEDIPLSDDTNLAALMHHAETLLAQAPTIHEKAAHKLQTNMTKQTYA